MNASTILRIDDNAEKVYSELTRLGFESQSDAERVLTFLSENQTMLKENEVIRKYQIEATEIPQGMIGFLIMEQNIFINLKITTILLAALLLDINLTDGFASLIVGMLGIPQNVIVKFNEDDGEKCIIHEAMNEKTISVNVLHRFNGECYNNQYKCKYNTNGKCTCTDEKIKEILDNLTEANMFKKVGDSYDLQW